MFTLSALRRFVIVSLGVVLAAPAILHGGANVWTGSRPAGEILSSAAQFASSAADPDVVYSAQENRLLKSADGGRTWTSIASFVEISSVHVSPASASTVYLGAARSGSAAGIFKSTDGGATWSQTLVANGGVSVDRIDSSAKDPNRSTPRATTSSTAATTAGPPGRRSPSRAGAPASTGSSPRCSSIRRTARLRWWVATTPTTPTPRTTTRTLRSSKRAPTRARPSPTCRRASATPAPCRPSPSIR